MISWTIHTSRPIDMNVFQYALARLIGERPGIDHFVLMGFIQRMFEEDLGIKLDASIMPARDGQEVIHEMQGLWGRN